MIHVLTAGLQTSIQDTGRLGLMHLGIAHTGAMDSLSAQLANQLVSNKTNAPVLEITLIGPTLKFYQATSIAITGASFSLTLNDVLVPCYKLIKVNRGDVLRFGRREQGARAYLAVAGGFNLPSVLGSRATHIGAHFGGYHGRALIKGDKLKFVAPDSEQTNIGDMLDNIVVQAVAKRNFTGSYLLRVTDTVESDLFTLAQWQQFLAQKYVVSQDSNRIGVRLTGAKILTKNLPELLSGGLLKGSIQIPPSGLPIIAGVDGPTVGGYPRIANVIHADLPLLGQLVPGDRVSFVRVSVDVARSLYREQLILRATGAG